MKPTDAASAPALSIVICTHKRPVLLDRLLCSLAVMDDLGRFDVEMIVVDNADDGSANDVVARHITAAALPLRYIAAHPANIALARNAGVRAARHPFIAFLDDDNEVPRQWLERVMRALQETGRDVLFGEVRPAFEDASLANPFVEAMFSRAWLGPRNAEPRAFRRPPAQGFSLGTANSIWRVATTLAADAPFDPRLGLCGGEDFALLCALQRRGRRFGWIEGIAVEEVVPAHRCTLDYLVQRHMAGAQGFVAGVVRSSRHPWLTEATVLARTLAQAAILLLWRWRAPASEERRWAEAIAWAGVRGKLTWRRLYPLYEVEAAAPRPSPPTGIAS